MPWRPDFFVPLQPSDPRNDDRLDPRGERIRIRLNRDGGTLVDFVVQYETPTPDAAHSHAVVLRSDMTHAPHVDRYDQFGRRRQEWLPAHLSPDETLGRIVHHIQTAWEHLRDVYYEGLQ